MVHACLCADCPAHSDGVQVHVRKTRDLEPERKCATQLLDRLLHVLADVYIHTRNAIYTSNATNCLCNGAFLGTTDSTPTRRSRLLQKRNRPTSLLFPQSPGCFSALLSHHFYRVSSQNRRSSSPILSLCKNVFRLAFPQPRRPFSQTKPFAAAHRFGNDIIHGRWYQYAQRRWRGRNR